MSGLEAFGLACNVMQTIGFAIEMASVCRTIFRTGSPDPSTATLLDHSTQITTNLKNSISSATPVTRDEKELLAIANKCLDAISTLKAEVDKLTRPSAKGKVFASLRLGVRSKFKEGEINKLEKRMHDYQKVLESGLLLRVCNQNNALQLKLGTGFQQLDSTMKRFIDAISQGHMKLQGLMMSHKDSIVQVVKAESSAQSAATTAIACEVKKTQEMIEEASLDAPMWEKRQRILKSLKYDSMGERFDQVKAAAEGTYRWMIQGVRPAPNRNQTEPDGVKLPSVCSHRTIDKKSLLWSCFPCWLESPEDKIYWVQGKAGSGKSTLMKFLVTNHALWYPQRPDGGQDPLILSHFLWAAGSPRQKSLHGILLNLLYQLLSNDQYVLDHVINTFPGLSLKDVEGDWTLEELEGTMVASLKAIATRPEAIATRPVFIFLDGLDEFESSNASVTNNPRTLLDLVTSLSTLGNVKACVSSRPEPIFKKKLGGLCNLRLQDLTRSDMETYAKAELLSNEIVDLDNQKDYQKLVDKLCNMADGVFLWTALAVRSLSRGLTNEDDICELYARLEKMPTGLYALYKDMWSRLNEDRDLYKEQAAQYFHLVIHWRRMPSHKFGDRCTTFHLLDPSISQAYLNDDTASFPSDLEATCEKLGKRIETRSAGLLEHGDQGSIDFIHRSALEFLTDTPEGQQIMAHDQSTPNELRSWLLQADVARAYLMFRKPFESPVFNVGGILHYIPDRWNGTEDFMLDVHLNWEESALPGDLQITLLEACKRMTEVDKWGRLYRWPHVDFAGYYAAIGHHNLVLPFLRYPQFSPHVEVIRSRSYRSYLFVAALAMPGTSFEFDYKRGDLATIWLGKAKVVEAILAEDPLLEFQDHGSSTGVESCSLESDTKIPAANEREAVLILLAALICEQEKLLKEHPAFSKPRKYVENFFRRYPHNEEKVILIISPIDRRPYKWRIDIEYLGPSVLSLNARRRQWERASPPVDLGSFVVIECDIAYAAELLTLGRASRAEGTGENKADTVTGRDKIWRRPAGLKKTDPRILVFGQTGNTNSGIDMSYGTPATDQDANRVLSNLDNIRSRMDGFNFSIPGLEESLDDAWKRRNYSNDEQYLKLVGANSFSTFGREFMESFNKLTGSAEYLSWLAEEQPKYDRVRDEYSRALEGYRRAGEYATRTEYKMRMREEYSRATEEYDRARERIGRRRN